MSEGDDSVEVDSAKRRLAACLATRRAQRTDRGVDPRGHSRRDRRCVEPIDDDDAKLWVLDIERPTADGGDDCDPRVREEGDDGAGPDGAARPGDEDMS